MWLDLLNAVAAATLFFAHLARPSLAIFALLFTTSPVKALYWLFDEEGLRAGSTILFPIISLGLLFLLEPTKLYWWAATLLALIGGGLVALVVQVAADR